VARCREVRGRVLDVSWAYGATHAQVCGPSNGRPVVLLHGGGAKPAVWLVNVATLSRTRRVYAVDPIGQAGRGAHDGQPIGGPADLMS
jgi:pimeloyl-ACP methyl ester carboxylesterase